MHPDDSTHEDHERHAVRIFVNTRSFDWTEKRISYVQVYELAYPNQPLSDGDVARVEYSRGEHGAGALQPGGSVKVKPDMVFDVYVTVRS